MRSIRVFAVVTFSLCVVACASAPPPDPNSPTSASSAAPLQCKEVGAGCREASDCCSGQCRPSTLMCGLKL